jgi:diguanylate cyclase (GGDEF)-like protein
VVSAMTAMLAAATAEEFWRGRAEPLLSRWPTVVVLLAYAAVLLAQIPAISLMPFFDSGSLVSGLSFALIAFGTLLFTVVMSFLLLNMIKERTELQHKINSLVDPLSGVANRRAFLDGAVAAFARHVIDREPLAVVLFDLDRFKDINDRLGHAVGDRVLQMFAATTAATLGSDILFGRVGGEEFAAVMPVGDLGEAYAVADRVRRNFIEAAARFSEDDLIPTVSVGLAVCGGFKQTPEPAIEPKANLERMLEIADRALYRAKSKGRNRVEATAPLEEIAAPAVCAPSIVPLLKPQGASGTWRRRAAL